MLLRALAAVLFLMIGILPAWAETPAPKDIHLTNLPYDLPMGGIFVSVFFVFFPFLLIIGIALYKKFAKKKSTPQS